MIVSHFAYYFPFERLHLINDYLAGSTGRIGVCLFFAISGYLVSHSLEKNSSLLRFYWFKFVHIVLPFISSYFALSGLFIGLAFLRPDFLQQTPISHVLFIGGDYKAFLLGVFPIDVHLGQFLQMPSYWFVGEWFIGTVVSLYIISPFLFCLAKKIPVLSMAGMIILSVIIYEQMDNWWNHGFWFFLVRMPEFYIGILLHMYRQELASNKERWMWVTFLLVTIVVMVDMVIYAHPMIADRFIPLKPRSFLFSFPMIIFVFLGSEWVNRQLDLQWVNEYSKKTYTFMLIQHVVINTFMWNFDEQNFSKLGVLVSFVFIFVTTVYLAGKITGFYKPIENFLLHKE